MSTSVADDFLTYIRLQPKQGQLWDLWENRQFTRIGYGGARGGSKSAGARLCLLLRRLTYPKTNGLILRRTYDELRKNHIEPLFRQFPFMRDWWSEGNKELNFPNGSKQYFGYAEHEDDVKRYVGAEFADIVPEEAGLFKEYELQMLEGSCRWSSGPIVPKMVYPFMPGGPGHAYLKRLFIDRDYRGEEKADCYAFIQAYGWDNIEWSRKSLEEEGLSEADYYAWTDSERRDYFISRTEYGRGLAGIADKGLRDAWLHGSWTIHEGTVFPELSEIHNLDQYQLTDTKHLKLIAGLDHATTGVTACVEHGVDWDENIFALDEYYESNRPIEAHASPIVAMLLAYGAGNLPGTGRPHGQQYILIDPSTEAKTLQRATMTGRYELASVLDEYSRHGIRATPAHRAMISVGIDVLHGLLAVDPLHRNPFTQQLGSPRYFISKQRCPNLWREMRDLQKQRNSDGNWEFLGSDHALDCSRYVAMSRPSPAHKLEQDISHLPSTDQMRHRVETSWAKGWAKADSGTWFSGMGMHRK